MNSFYFLSEKGMRGGQGSKTVQSKCNCLLETEDNRKRGDLQLQKKKKKRKRLAARSSTLGNHQDLKNLLWLHDESHELPAVSFSQEVWRIGSKCHLARLDVKLTSYKELIRQYP